MGMFGILERTSSAKHYVSFPPLDLAYAASLLESNGFHVEIIDASVLSLDKIGVLKLLSRKEPSLIIINTCGVSFYHDLDFARSIKKITQIPVAIIEPYPGFIHWSGSIFRGFDFVIRREIEYTVLELCEKFPDVEKIKGLIHKKDNKIITNPTRSLIKNLDELPFPAYHLLPVEKYSYDMLEKKPFLTLLTSRGCPFNCFYCTYPLGYGKIWRGRSPENVIEELKLLKKKYKVKSILFRDQVFTFDQSRAEKICEYIIQEDLDVKWRCETRIDCLSKNLMKKMKAANCVGVHIGIESGDTEILKKFGKVGISIEKVKRVFRDAKKIDLELLAFFMIGFPGETKESVQKTFTLAKELNAERCWFNPATPYPGTEFYKMAESKGWLLTKNLERYTSRNVVMRTDLLTEEEIRRFVETGNLLFSKSRKQLLKTVFSRRGIKTAFLDPKRAIKFTVGRFFKNSR
jgi:radical SAM superfamily enzyme YgiQ (UPF0313 family)